MEPGLYVTFFNEGESFNKELPPIGPLEHVVVRDGSLIADRRDGDRADFDGGGSWIEAEYEFQRATGREPGGARRADLRIVAPQGVYLRFVSFGAAAEHDPVPELGPYAVIVIGRRAVEADGDPLALRIGTNQNLWELTEVGGSALVGQIRPDIAFRTRSTRYHPEIKPFRSPQPAAALEHPAKPHNPALDAPDAVAPKLPAKPLALAHHAASAPANQRPAKPHSPAPHPAAAPAPAPATRQTEAAAISLRDRIRTDQSARPDYAVASPVREGRDFLGALWRLRFFVIAALIVVVAVLSVPSALTLLTGRSPSGPATVSVNTSLTSPDWTYRVGSVRRVARIGSAQARGTYLVVQVAATNRKGAGAQILPSHFSLVAANGDEYRALATTSGVYSSAENLTSSYAWPTEFRAGRSVVLPIVFELSPSVTGTQLVILDVPSTRIRLE